MYLEDSCPWEMMILSERMQPEGPDCENRELTSLSLSLGQLSEVSPSYPKVKVGRWLEVGIHNLSNLKTEVSYKLKHWFQSPHQD